MVTKTICLLPIQKIFFADDPKAYKGNGFGTNVNVWLDLSSHEVGHLKQINKHNNLLGYLGEFVGQYVTSGSHDGAPYEKEAEAGANNFRMFSDFINKKVKKNGIAELLGSGISEEKKINRINDWFKMYQDANKEKDKKNSGQ